MALISLNLEMSQIRSAARGAGAFSLVSSTQRSTEHPRANGRLSRDFDAEGLFRNEQLSRRRRRRRTLTLALTSHAALIASLMVLPPLWAEFPPPARPARAPLVAFVEVAPPPPPPPPPAPARSAPAPKRRAVPRPRPSPPPVALTAVVAEPEEPLRDEASTPEQDGLELESAGVGAVGGVSGGVAGGVPGGIVGGVSEEPSEVPPAPPTPLRVGGEVKAPRLVHEVAPIYPPLAKQARLSATIIMEVQVDDAGRVSSVKVLRGDPMFDQAAIDSIRQRRYEPLLLNGRPWSFVATVVVQFTFNRA